MRVAANRFSRWKEAELVKNYYESLYLSFHLINARIVFFCMRGWKFRIWIAAPAARQFLNTGDSVECHTCARKHGHHNFGGDPIQRVQRTH